LGSATMGEGDFFCLRELPESGSRRGSITAICHFPAIRRSTTPPAENSRTIPTT
jgi:hypothetical protein